MLKMQYNTNFEIVIQPISSLYDLLPNNQTSTYLKELSNVNNYSDYITAQDTTYKLSDASKKQLESYISNLNFTKFIDNKEKFEFNFIVLPYDNDALKLSYPDIDETKVINNDFTLESIINSIETNIRKIQNEHTDLQYIKIFYYVPLYDNEQLEYRYKRESIKSPIYYKDVFNIKNFEKIKNLPMINNIQINDTIKSSLESLFSKLKKKDNTGDDIEFIKFLDTLYKYSRNKKTRDDIINKSKFYKVLILYSTDFLDKDITKLNNETYYELPSLSIEKEYIETNKTMQDYLKEEKTYIDSTFKKNKDNYKCIGKINKVGYNKYKFTLLLRELIFGNKLNDTIIDLYIKIETNVFGFIHNYSIYYEEEDEEDEETKKTKQIKYVQIQNTKGILKIFDENEIKVLKYNNIDKSLSDSNELIIPKVYKINEEPLKTYLKRDPTSIDMINYLTSPTELSNYQLFVEQYYPKLKFKKRKLENKLVTNKEEYKSFLKLLFKENALFHLKPRDNQVVSNTQYKMKMENVSIYEFNNATNTNYKEALDTLFHKKLQSKYNKIILNTKPDFLIYVNLLLQKNNFKKTNYDCKEIKYKLLKYTKKLVLGGTLKLKENKKSKQNIKHNIKQKSKQKKHNKYNRECYSKQLSRRFSHRKV